jgi:hypothetical protein
VAYIFQIGRNKLKLLREYETETQKVLLFIELMLHNTKQLQNEYFFLLLLLFDLKIIGHGNPDNNIKSHCKVR